MISSNGENNGGQKLLKACGKLMHDNKVSGLLATLLQPQSTFIIPIIWNTTALRSARTSQIPITTTTRALAIIHTSMFDAWAAYDNNAHGTTLDTILRRPIYEHTLKNKEEAISHAAYHALCTLFPQQKEHFKEQLRELGYHPDKQEKNAITPCGIGHLAASMVLKQRENDGSNDQNRQNDTSIKEKNGKKYNSTGPDKKSLLRSGQNNTDFARQNAEITPHWGGVRPFALRYGAQFRPVNGATQHPQSRYFAQVNQILDLNTSLNDVQKVIAEYWTDDIHGAQSPDHWYRIAQYVARRDAYTLDATVKLFFILTNALFDASIACWDTKYAYQSERPVQAIHALFTGKQLQTRHKKNEEIHIIAGQDWYPYLRPYQRPPTSPEFCAEQSTISSVASAILSDYSGSDYFGGSYTMKAGASQIEPGSTPAQDIRLHWKTFSDAARQAGMAQRYAGLQFEQGDLAGRQLGTLVATQIWSQINKYLPRY